MSEWAWHEVGRECWIFNKQTKATVAYVKNKESAEDICKVRNEENAAQAERIKQLEGELRLCLVGSCTCMTKTPESKYHKDDCGYKRISTTLSQGSRALFWMLVVDGRGHSDLRGNEVDEKFG